jgi:hypothetical protein
VTLNVDLGDASDKIRALRAGRLPARIPADAPSSASCPSTWAG